MHDIESGDGNVYADLGVENADEQMIKAQLAATIQKIVDAKGMTKAMAAETLGLSQSKLSRLLRGHFRGISEARMLEYLTRLGQNVRIVIEPARQSGKIGHVEVVEA